MNRAELVYADVLKAKLGDMNKRWEYIVQKTEQEKAKLQNGLDKFKLVDSGIKDIYMYLKSLEGMMQAEELENMDSTTAQTKVDQYKVGFLFFLLTFYVLVANTSAKSLNEALGNSVRHKRTGRKNLVGLSDTKPIVCQHFCPTNDKNLPEWG